MFISSRTCVRSINLRHFKPVVTGAVGDRLMGKPKRIRDLQCSCGSRIATSRQNVDDQRGRADAVMRAPLQADSTAARPSAGTHPNMVTICRSPYSTFFNRFRTFSSRLAKPIPGRERRYEGLRVCEPEQGYSDKDHRQYRNGRSCADGRRPSFHPV